MLTFAIENILNREQTLTKFSACHTLMRYDHFDILVKMNSMIY